MPRTLEIVRQWELILALDKAPHGLTLRRLADLGKCSTRTVRRDLAALQRAGFPLYDEKVDGSAKWRLTGNPLKGLDTGFRLTELCALYFSRAPIPWHRDAWTQARTSLSPQACLRHIGIYGYRAFALRAFAALPRGVLEQLESLEQLRALEAGWRIAVDLAPQAFPPGVDTPEDLVRAEAVLAAGA